MRARNIKPGFFDNDILGNLPPLTRLLFIGLWTMADKEGRLEDNPRKIKKVLLGYDDVSADDVNVMLQSLHNTDFIIRYAVDDTRYIQVTNFTKHQRPHNNETESVIPPYNPAQKTQENQEGESAFNQGSKSFPPRLEALRPDSLNLIPDTGYLNEECPTFDQGTKPLVQNPEKPARSRSPSPASSPKKIKYLDSVFLSEVEYTRLREVLGGQKSLESAIEKLDYSITCKGGKYHDHYKTLRNWHKRGFLEPQGGRDGPNSDTTATTGTHRSQYSPWGGNRRGEYEPTPEQARLLDELKRDVAAYQAGKAQSAAGETEANAGGDSS